MAYLEGRAQFAAGNYSKAEQLLIRAMDEGYRAARIDLGVLYIARGEDKARMDLGRSLLTQAWNDRIAYAAVPLARSSHDANEMQSWIALGKQRYSAAAFALGGEEEDHAALAGVDRDQRETLLLHALSDYAEAVRLAENEDWPEISSRDWRYRRATLTRKLPTPRVLASLQTEFDTHTLEPR